MPPNWMTAINFETKAEAQERHAKIVRHALFSYGASPSLRAVVACGLTARCLRDGCPSCLRRFRKELVKAIRAAHLFEGEWTTVSIISRGHLYRPGHLADFDIGAATKAMNRRLARSSDPDALFIGGWDVSYNMFENEAVGYQVHLYGLIDRPKSEELSRWADETFNLDPLSHRPKVLRPVDDEVGFLKSVTYSNKSVFSRRSGYFDPDRPKADGTPSKNTDDLPLRHPQLLEVTSWLAQYPVGSRLILRNLKRISPPGAKLRLKRLD